MTPAGAVSATRWGVVLALWAAGLGAAAQYAKISVVLDPLGAAYGTSGAGLGLMVSAVGVLGIMLGVVGGRVVASLGTRRAMLAGLLLGAAMSGIQATLPPLWLFFASRVVEGVAHLALVIAAPTLIARLSAPRHQGATLTLWGTFFGVAFAILFAVGLPLVEARGVGALFAAHAAYMALFALALWRLLPRDPAGGGLPGLGQVLRDHGRIYASPRLGAAAAGWLFYTFCFVTTLTFFGPFIAEPVRATVLSVMPLLSIAVSMTLGVWLLSRIAATTVVTGAFALGAAIAVALVWAPGNVVLCLAFISLLGIVQGASFAIVPQLNAADTDRALANGGMAQTGNVGNSVGTPVVAALLPVAGHTGMVLALAAALGMGALVHLALARARRGTAAPVA
ncbi:MAG: MFS transporter [Shimia sp.]